jgi:hypothetical protein
VSFELDTLRNWYSNLSSVGGDFLLAKNFASKGNLVKANQTLDLIPVYRALNTQMVKDVDQVRWIVNSVSPQNIRNLTTGVTDTLELISNGIGHASSMARNILMLNGYRFNTNYVLPNIGTPGYNTHPAGNSIEYADYGVYPNPTDGDRITVTINNAKYEDLHTLDFWAASGKRVGTFILKGKMNNISLTGASPGIIAYTISKNGQILSSGRLLLLK